MRYELLRLATTAVMLLLAAGCMQSPRPAADQEADIICYWNAEAHADQTDVRDALYDGRLTERECSEVVMPHIDAFLEQARHEARQDAIRAASAAAALRALAEKGDE